MSYFHLNEDINIFSLLYLCYKNWAKCFILIEKLLLYLLYFYLSPFDLNLSSTFMLHISLIFLVYTDEIKNTWKRWVVYKLGKKISKQPITVSNNWFKNKSLCW